MPTYAEYLKHCTAKKIQAMQEQMYNKLVRVGFNPISSTWH